MTQALHLHRSPSSTVDVRLQPETTTTATTTTTTTDNRQSQTDSVWTEYLHLCPVSVLLVFARTYQHHRLSCGFCLHRLSSSNSLPLLPFSIVSPLITVHAGWSQGGQKENKNNKRKEKKKTKKEKRERDRWFFSSSLPLQQSHWLNHSFTKS